MSATVDKPHILIIEDCDGEKEWRIVHPVSCKWEAHRHADSDLFGAVEGEPRWHFHRACLTQWEIDGNGIDSLEVHCGSDEHIDPAHAKASPFEAGWLSLRPGRYVVQAAYSWSGSWWDEADNEFYIDSVRQVTPA